MEQLEKRHRMPVWAVPAFSVCLCFSLCMMTIAFFTGSWVTKTQFYYSYALQAENWLRGSLHIEDGDNYTWLELAIYNGDSYANRDRVASIEYDEDTDQWYALASDGRVLRMWTEDEEASQIEDRYFVSFPPFPSYVMLPFVALTGIAAFQDAWIAFFFAMLGCIYAVRLYVKVTGGTKHVMLWALFLLLGNGYIYLTMNAWVWFIAQNMCFSLMMMSLYYAYTGKGGLSLAFWACAVGCRPMALLWLPVLAALILHHWRHLEEPVGLWRLIARKWYWAIAPALIGCSYMLLNWLRFGNVLEFGHNYLPEFTRSENGQFSLNYFIPNLLQYLRLPELDMKSHQVMFNSIDGNAFYLLNPLLVFFLAAAICALIARRGPLAVRILLPLSVIAYICVICLHKTLGGVQFGNRYLVDVMPFAWFGVILWKKHDDAALYIAAPLAVYGAAVNIIGTIYSFNNLL